MAAAIVEQAKLEGLQPACAARAGKKADERDMVRATVEGDGPPGVLPLARQRLRIRKLGAHEAVHRRDLRHSFDLLGDGLLAARPDPQSGKQETREQCGDRNADQKLDQGEPLVMGMTWPPRLAPGHSTAPRPNGWSGRSRRV